MPKRLSRTTRLSQKHFRNGYHTGVSATFFGLQLQAMRVKKGVTQEEVAIATGLPVGVVSGLETAKFDVFLSADTDCFTKLAKYFDVAVQIKLTSDVACLETLDVATFDEETAGVSQEKPTNPTSKETHDDHASY